MNQSVVIIAPDASRSAANAALAAYYGDDVGAQNLSLALSADGQSPATHWASHIWLEPTRATDIKDWPSGTLPEPVTPWSVRGLNATTALAAGQSLIVGVMAATDQNFGTLPTTNFDAVIGALGLQRII